jgi:hypothetical protein
MYQRVMSVFVCDTCQRQYELVGDWRSRKANKLTYDTVECGYIARKPGGPLNEQIKRTNTARYGVPVSSKALAVKAKAKTTNLEKYGVESTLQLSHVHKAGIDAAASDEARAKARATCVAHLGVENPMQSEEVRVGMRKRCLEKRGVEHHWQLDDVKEKRKQTWVDHYGVDNPFKAREVIDKFDRDSMVAKALETMKRNNSYRKSAPEDAIYTILCDHFGVDDVERQKTMNFRWPIDFYVRSIDTYVQYDGKYWHGHDRPLEEIMQFKKPRDHNIYRNMLTAQKQTDWFKQQGLKLVRITDVIYEQGPECVVNACLSGV